MMTVRLPGLLDAALAEKARLKPTACSLTLQIKGAGEANMTLPEDAPAAAIHDWITMYTSRGLAGIYRVTNISQRFKHQRDLTLLHAIDILSDSVWQAQTDFEGTKAEYLAALLNQQTQLVNGVKPWVLGTCADTSTVKRTINYDRLSTLLEEQEDDAGDYYFTYDFSSFPWVLNYVAKPSAVSCEFRLARNVSDATVTYNDSDLCTRLILSNNHRSPDADTNVTSNDFEILTYNNAAAQAEYGIVVKTADIDTGDDVKTHEHAEADAWAADFMALRAAPSVQIQIDGEELFGLTGDTWDEYSVGRMCRVALPDYRHTFVERVVSVTYPDLLKTPAKVTVSLANALPRFSEAIATAQKTASAAGSAAHAAARAAADAKEVTTWSQTVKYYGEALDGTGVLTLYETGIDMDATGGATIYSLVEGVQALYGGIQVNAGALSLVVSSSTDPTTGEVSHAVNTGSIILAINGGTGHSSAAIEADVVTIGTPSGSSAISVSDVIKLTGGDVQVEGDISSWDDVSTRVLTVGSASDEPGHGADVQFIDGYFSCGSRTNFGSEVAFNDTLTFYNGNSTYTLTMSQMADVIKSASVANNVLTLTKVSGGTVNFSKATTLGGAWGSGTGVLTVTATQTNYNTTTEQNETTPVGSYVSNHYLNFDGNGQSSFSVKLKTQDTGEQSQTTRKSLYGYLVLTGSGSSSSVVVGPNSDGSGYVGSLSVGSLYSDGYAEGYADGYADAGGGGSSNIVYRVPVNAYVDSAFMPAGYAYEWIAVEYRTGGQSYQGFMKAEFIAGTNAYSGSGTVSSGCQGGYTSIPSSMIFSYSVQVRASSGSTVNLRSSPNT